MHIEIGKAYCLRTVSDYWVGRVVSIDGPSTVTIEDYAWVASTGRLTQFLATGGFVNGDPIANLEVEIAPDGMKQEVHYLTISEWPYPLLRKQV